MIRRVCVAPLRGALAWRRAQMSALPQAKRSRADEPVPQTSRTAWIEHAAGLPSWLDFARPASSPVQGPGEYSWANVRAATFVGTKAALTKAVAALPAEWGQSYGMLLNAVKEKPLPGDVEDQQTLFSNGSDGQVCRLRMGCITTQASRHNTKHRTDQVFRYLRTAAKPCSGSLLVLCVTEAEAVLPYVATAAKVVPLCTLRGAFDGTNPDRPVSWCIVVQDGAVVPPLQLQQHARVAESIQLAAFLVDLPANYLDASTYVELLRRLQKRYGFGLNVISGEELLRQGLNLIHAVGRAGEHPPALAILSHRPEGADPSDALCIVGKGIVYDTGGLCIKTRKGMCGMKADMGGSATALGAFLAAVRNGTPRVLHAALALADNAVGSLALRPDDVIRCLSGKTVEINNTDAEGRLVLADAAAYCARHLGPTAILDIATLTGAQGSATGKLVAAVLSNDESAEQLVVSTGRRCGELCFPVVYAPELLLTDMSSKVADFRNSLGDTSNARVSAAGLFIQQCGLPDYDKKWVHIDMAAPAGFDERATGFGVSLLCDLFTTLR